MKLFTVLFLIAFAVVLVDGQRRFGRRGPGGPRGLRLAGRPGGRSFGGAGRFGGIPQFARQPGGSQRGFGPRPRPCPARPTATTAPSTVASPTLASPTVAPSSAAPSTVAIPTVEPAIAP